MKYNFFFSPGPEDSDNSSSDPSQDPTNPDDPSTDPSQDPANPDAPSTDDPPHDPGKPDDPSTDPSQDPDSPTDPSTDPPGDRDNPADPPNDNSPHDPGKPDDPSTDPSQDPVSSDDPSGSTDSPLGNNSKNNQPVTGSSGPKRPYNVESWRAMITTAAGSLPVNALMKWIEVESGGNPCATGMMKNGSSIENGLFQLYSPDDDHFGSPSQLHGSFCNGQTQSCSRDLTADEANIQVNSGIALVNKCVTSARSQLTQAGLTWDEKGSDFWCIVKMQHIYPSPTAACIKLYKPSSWADFKKFMTQHYPKYSNHFDNAEKIGNAIS